jgi:hypothetical protein
MIGVRKSGSRGEREAWLAAAGEFWVIRLPQFYLRVTLKFRKFGAGGHLRVMAWGVGNLRGAQE